MFSHLPVQMSPQVSLVRWWMKTLGDRSVEKTPRITPLWAATMMGFIISGSAVEPRGPNSILHIYYIVSMGSDCLGVITLELCDGSLGQSTQTITPHCNAALTAARDKSAQGCPKSLRHMVDAFFFHSWAVWAIRLAQFIVCLTVTIR